jgi:hypothetical protein
VHQLEDAYDDVWRYERATLREALAPEELSDLLAQLPRSYQEALITTYEPSR